MKQSQSNRGRGSIPPHEMLFNGGYLSIWKLRTSGRLGVVRRTRPRSSRECSSESMCVDTSRYEGSTDVGILVITCGRPGSCSASERVPKLVRSILEPFGDLNRFADLGNWKDVGSNSQTATPSLNSYDSLIGRRIQVSNQSLCATAFAATQAMTEKTAGGDIRIQYRWMTKV